MTAEARLAKVRQVLDAWCGLAHEPTLWPKLTDEPPTPHVALSLIDAAVDPDEPEPPPESDSAAALRDAIERATAEDVGEGEGRDRRG